MNLPASARAGAQATTTNGAGAHTAIRRAFVQVGERRVHYRIAGAGAPVLLLHQSPRSSAELVPLMRLLAPQFLVVAPDTPGYGQSDPVAPSSTEPTIDVFADAVVDFAGALGLGRFALYGSHTGAIIATRVAHRHPQRVAALVANGILMTSPEERSDKADRYLPPLVPQWDGGHLAWLWSRLRDQLVFYPWYKHDPGCRIQWTQSLEETDASALDLLESGDNYRGAYGAVLTYDIAEDLPTLAMPTLMVVAKPDALSRFVASYPPMPSCVEVSVVPDFPDVYTATLEFLRRQSLAPAAQPVPTTAAAGRLVSEFVDVAGGQLHWRRARDESGRPLVVLHDFAGSAAALEPMLRGLAGARPLFAPDLPGHGESDRLGATTPDEIAACLLAALDAAGVTQFDLAVQGAAAALVAPLRRRGGARLQRTALLEPLPQVAGDAATLARAALPDLGADSAGSHLARGWMYLRDRALYFPWHERSAAAQLALGRPPRPVEQQRALLDLLKSRSAAPAQLEAALAALPGVAADAAGCVVLARRGAAIRRGGVALLDLPDEKFQWGGRLLRALDG